MSQYKEGTRDQLIGFVSGVRANKDGTTRFAIGRKGVRTTFSLPPKDAREHLVEDHPERVEVGPVVDAPAVGLLR